MSGCTIQLWFNKQRIKKNGEASLYLQIIGKGESAEVPLKLAWPADKFDWNNKALKPRFKDDPDLIIYNAAIERERSRYWQAVMAFLKDGRSFTLSELFNRVNLYSEGQTLAQFMDDTINARLRANDIDLRIKPDTAKSHRTVVKVLRKYTKDKDIVISAINANWLRKFANHERRELCENSVWTRIKIIKTYLSLAKKQNIDVDPDYKLFKIKMDAADPTWLDDHEIRAILNIYRHPLTHQTTKRMAKAFLFACFTGLRISDLSRWSKDWISGGFISFHPKKQRLSKKKAKPLTIPIIPIAQEFINDLAGETFDLPTEQAYNRELKELAKMAGINKVITSHVARHTFATWLAIDGVPTIVISSLLGHADIKTTMIYVHVAEKYKAVEMIKLQKRFGAVEKNKVPEHSLPETLT